MYNVQIAYYRECTKYNRKGTEAIQTKLSDLLIALKVAPGRLPMDVTLVIVCNHLLAKARVMGTNTNKYKQLLHTSSSC